MSSPAPVEPPGIERFVSTLNRCGLFGRGEVYALLQAAPTAARADAGAFAEHLVARDKLSHFQASKLLQGFWQGLVLGPYQIVAPLGRGGTGTVYLARVGADQPAPGEGPDRSRLVALKVLPPKKIREDEHKLARFLREMDMARRVSHPHLTRTFDSGEFQGVYYIAMEYIRGENLTRRVAEFGPLLVPRAARLFSEAAAGLAHAHERGLIHRDLKPSNIMVTPNGHAKVLDLGFALAAGEELPADKRVVGGQGYVVGTMDYIAPEQVDDPTGVDHRADLYALGCSIYFALTGQPPFPGGTAYQKMQWHRTGIPEPITELNPTVPAPFIRLVERLMAKDPRRRFADAGATRKALLMWTAGDPELPLDVTTGQDDDAAVREVESSHRTAAAAWDAMPLIAFRGANTSGSLTAPPASPPAANPPPAPSTSDALPVTPVTEGFFLDSLPAPLRALFYAIALLGATLLLWALRG